jgi:hypothetical protein
MCNFTHMTETSDISTHNQRLSWYLASILFTLVVWSDSCQTQFISPRYLPLNITSSLLGTSHCKPSVHATICSISLSALFEMQPMCHMILLHSWSFLRHAIEFISFNSVSGKIERKYLCIWWWRHTCKWNLIKDYYVEPVKFQWENVRIPVCGYE